MEPRAAEGWGRALALGPFDLAAPLGAGGMGVVWKGAHRQQGVPVAVKVISQSWSEEEGAQEAFQREVRAIASLAHPGIVAVHDVGQVSEAAAAAAGGRLIAQSPYLAMELLPRGNLERLQPAMDWPLLRQIALDLLDALGHAHAHGVVHCDVKPQNVLLADGTGGKVAIKVTDFGVAHAFASAAEEGEALGPVSAGTPAYMPPEQLAGRWREYGPWTDLYAVGCMLWEMATGLLPFLSGDLGELVRLHLYEAPPPFIARFPAPAGLEGWLRRLLAKGPGERFERCADAAWALRGLERGVHEVITWGQVEGRLGGAAPADPEQATALVPARRFTTVDVGSATTMASDKVPAVEALRARGAGKVAARERPPWPVEWRRPGGDAPVNMLVGTGLGLFGLRSIPLVDREEERDLLWNALASVHAHGEARALIVRGPSGVGKSRLIEWIAVRAHELGAAEVLKAVHGPMGGPADGIERMLARHLRCVGLGGEELREHLREVAERLAPEADGEALRELVATIAALVRPEEGAVAGWPRVRFADDRERRAALADVLGRLGSRRPLLVWLDDVMWGADALGLCRHVFAGGGRRLPALFVLTVRDDQLAERPFASRLLRELGELPAAIDTITIGELPAADHHTLVERLLGLRGELVDAIAARTMGNPMFAVELVGDWVERGLLTPSRAGFTLREGAAVELPDDVHDLWRRRIERLLATSLAAIAGAPAALEVAAILGQEVDRGEWEATVAAAGAGGAARAVLGVLLEERLAIATATGFHFVHGMLRESLERRAREGGRAAGLHRLAAATLEARYGARSLVHAERIGQHRVAAGDLAAAVDPLLDACYRLQIGGGYERAEKLLGQVESIVHRLSLGEGDPRRLRARMQRVWLRWMRSDGGGKAELAREVADIEGLARQAGALALLGEALRFRGLEARFGGDLDASLGPLAESLRVCRAAGDVEEVARSELGFAVSLRALGRLDEAEGHLGAAVAIAEAEGLDVILPRCFGNLAEIALQRRRWADARHWFERAVAASEAVGDRKALAFNLGGLGDLALSQDHLEGAQGLYRRAEGLFSALGSRYVHGVRLNQAVVHLLRGRGPAARSLFVDHLAGQGGRDRLLEAQAHLGLAALAGEAGDLDGDDGLEAHLRAAAARLAGVRESRRALVLLAGRVENLAEGAGRSETAARTRALALALEAGLDRDGGE